MTLSRQSNIRWSRSDYITLGKAVSNFNKKINELNADEKKLYLPEIRNYQEVKENIKTRSEFKRVINSLKRFSREGAEDLYITASGQELTKWERKELSIQTRIASRRLNRELQELNLPMSSGYSRLQMGSIRAKEIEAQLKSLKKLEMKKGFDFERIKRRLEFLGTSDYSLKQSYVFRQNFMEQLDKLRKNSPEFQRVYDFFNEIKNPIDFFNTTQKSQVLEDFFTWYQQPENYGAFESKEDVANWIIKEYKLY